MKVTYEDHMGSDLQVANCARVSFAKRSRWELSETGFDPDTYAPTFRTSLKDADQRLIQFLARGCTTGEWDSILDEVDLLVSTREDIAEILQVWRKTPRHWVPFANGGTILLHLKVPIFVARQLAKHQAGFEPWSEVSRRYVTDDPEFYVPDQWRKAAENKKQGSLEEPVTNLNKYGDVEGEVDRVKKAQMSHYRNLLDAGVCPEQARMVLPQSMYTEFYWKGNLYAWASLYNTRMDSHTQAETREVARQIGDIIQPLFPVSWSALADG